MKLGVYVQVPFSLRYQFFIQNAPPDPGLGIGLGHCRSLPLSQSGLNFEAVSQILIA